LDKKLKIIAVIPIYFPDDSLYDNINTYIEYIDCLIIINNSQSIIDNFKNHLQTDKIIFYNPEKNIGLSKSYNFALSYAISNFYDYLLIMDQDSKFIKYSIWQHLNYLIKDSKIALISASSSKDRSDLEPLSVIKDMNTRDLRSYLESKGISGPKGGLPSKQVKTVY
jgi:GT2 family glycosyltransferase